MTATVVLIHDAGVDLDAWGSLPASLATAGYRVQAVDLPGHGLSDDPWEPERANEVIAAIVDHARSLGPGALFAISMGELAPAVGARPFDAHVAVSPRPAPDWLREESRSPCLIFVGGADADSANAADRYFRGRLGYSVISSFGVPDNGAALLRSSWASHLQEQTVAFLRDYARP
jgi:pimeloyl-ACP methyl ester carboxylesterase